MGVLQQRKGVQQGQVKGCEVRPFFPIGKAVLLLCFCPCLADGLHSELGRCNGMDPVPVGMYLHLNVMCHVSAGMQFAGFDDHQGYAKS